MKKRKLLLAVATALFTVSFAGCGGEDTLVMDKSTTAADAKENVTNEETKEVKENKKGYYFTYKDIDIAVNDDMKTVYEKIGEEADIRESPSCKYTGNDKNYTFNDFSVTAFIDEEAGVEKIYAITLMSDLVGTNEGISVGDSVTDIAEKYGKPAEEGVYKYSKDGMYIQFSVKNDTVSGITYTID